MDLKRCCKHLCHGMSELKDEELVEWERRRDGVRKRDINIYHLSSFPLLIREWRMMTSWPISPNSQWMPLKVTNCQVNCVGVMAIPREWATLFGAKIHKGTSFPLCTVLSSNPVRDGSSPHGNHPKPFQMPTVDTVFDMVASQEIKLIFCIWGPWLECFQSRGLAGRMYFIFPVLQIRDELHFIFCLI